MIERWPVGTNRFPVKFDPSPAQEQMTLKEFWCECRFIETVGQGAQYENALIYKNKDYQFSIWPIEENGEYKFMVSGQNRTLSLWRAKADRPRFKCSDTVRFAVDESLRLAQQADI